MKDNIVGIISSVLQKLKEKEIKIEDKIYKLFIFKEEPDLGLYEGILFEKVEDKNELSVLKKYDPYKEGVAYCPRIVVIIHKDKLYIKDNLENRIIVKTITKINDTFLRKLKKALGDPSKENLQKLFDRTDIIEEFYQLYRKSREYLLKNLKGISDDEKRREFVDNLMMQMLTLWYLQERGFFNNDKEYFINKFNELKQKKLGNGFSNYYDFLKYLFKKISSNVNSQYYEDEKLGKVVVIGPAVFLNGGLETESVEIPDKCFYQQNLTETLIELPPKKVGTDVSLLNLLESRDWTEGNIDEYVLGAIYEKLINYDERKKTGAYYTPEEITSYICENTIKPYLVDKVNEMFGKEFKSVDNIIETGEKEMLFSLFDLLKEIKICDPAVGSAHFLESTINVLLDIYEKIWSKCKEIGISEGLKILVVDEKGDLQEIDLLDIKNEERFKLYVKFFIILSRNIYGVDINPSALKVAKARLFLTLAKHFRVGKDKDIFIRFPNVHFNLREGNSLIGYVGWLEKSEAPQYTLFNFMNDQTTGYVKKLIKPVKELEDFLKKTSKSLELEGDIVKEIDELNTILAKKKLDWKDFEKVLKTKEKLIQILIVSLNSEHAQPLNDLLNRINELFNEKLDEKFANDYRINLKDLKKIKTFHWIFEFPEVFLKKNPGFDIVIGNPPYVRQEDIDHIVEGIEYKEILSTLYNPFDNTFDFSMFFILRSIEITKEKGTHSFIITNKWLRAKYGKKIRRFLKENTTIEKVIDFNGIKVFVGATVDTMIYITKKEKPNKDNKIFYNNPKDLENIEEGGYFVKQSNLDDEVWNFIDERILEIKEWIEKVGKPLKELDVKIYRGITTGFNDAFIIDEETRKKLIEEDAKSEELIKPVLRGRDIGRYYVEWDKKWIIVIPAGFTKRLFKKDLSLKDAEELFKKEYPSIYRHFEPFKYKKGKGKGLVDRDDQGDYWWELRPCDYYQEFEKPKIVWQEISVNSMFSWDLGIFYIPNNAYIMTNSSKTHLMILNSKLIEEIFKQISQFLSNGYRHTKQYIEKIPIRLPTNTKSYEILVDYMLFLNATEERRTKEKELIEFVDKQIIDSLVYELYFKEKFKQDGIKTNLLELVEPYLKDISNLNSDGQKLQIIREVVKKIKNDKKIMEQIERIKSHRWVKVSEGGEK